MVETLIERSCTPCKGGSPPLTQGEAQSFHAQVAKWELAHEARRIERAFKFKNFGEAFAFVQKVGELAETQGHHPDISFGWGYAKVALQTK
jgi:4a-hydroxytetrahydrobiopterin dehydratase